MESKDNDRIPFSHVAVDARLPYPPPFVQPFISPKHPNNTVKLFPDRQWHPQNAHQDCKDEAPAHTLQHNLPLQTLQRLILDPHLTVEDHHPLHKLDNARTLRPDAGVVVEALPG